MEVRDTQLDVIPVKRNPYLVDYERERSARQAVRGQNRAVRPNAHRAVSIRKRQRRQVQRMAVFLGVITVVVLGVSLLIKHNSAAAAGNSQKFVPAGGQKIDEGNIGGLHGAGDEQLSGATVQGIPAEKFAEHPEWQENFLTPNEYSRPGDALEEVKNIFVHYTANPGTSAAQNRSYFERQKDEHQASVSAHFIIGYEGEIIQCVPLTEIAYAVQTRNFDSVSIECCHKAKDGSFTQETYDSLVSLLAWLIDVYDLDTEDILRHYDCGGKKCPLYFTDHEDKWEQLKADVDAAAL